MVEDVESSPIRLSEISLNFYLRKKTQLAKNSNRPRRCAMYVLMCLNTLLHHSHVCKQGNICKQTFVNNRSL